ncbi:MAG: DUF1501 domain-containing protein [Bryobacteraceae bacterium]
MNFISRRSFLRVGAGLGTAAWAGGLGRFGLLNALTPAASDYRALVCVFLFGGNDSNNMIVPMDSQSFNAYTNVRKGLALSGSSLLQVQTPSQAIYGFHPNLGGLQKLFQAQKLAVVANVGTLVQPLTRSLYLNNQSLAPANLFSHADQQMQWQTTTSRGVSNTGWGGRLADAMAGANPSGSLPTFISIAGNIIQGSGGQTSPATVVPGAALGLQGFNSSAASQARLNSMQELLTFDTGATLIQQASATLQQGIANDATLSKALAGAAPLKTAFPSGNNLAAQLQQVAKIIQVRAALGMNRQIFFCSISSFDTHSSQISDQGALFTQVAAAMSAFDEATQELGVEGSVVTFTESDFSRTFMPNTNGGSDHAWGSHHLVMGGAVKGGDIYGTFPEFAIGGPDDVGEGRWIPGFSVDQYGATMAEWFGAPAAQLYTVFPNLPAFSVQNLGFLG